MLSTLCLTTLEYLNVSDNFICDLVLYFISNGNNLEDKGCQYIAYSKLKNILSLIKLLSFF